MTFLRQIIDKLVNESLYHGEASTDLTIDGQVSVDIVAFKNRLEQKLLSAAAGEAATPTLDITYAELLTAISGSTLTEGATYKITDRGDRGIYFLAIADDELSRTGIRKMLCPAFYGVGGYVATITFSNLVGTFIVGERIVANNDAAAIVLTVGSGTMTARPILGNWGPVASIEGDDSGATADVDTFTYTSGNKWIGVWNATKNPNIGDLTIWGGLVFESVTGNIGTATTDILLDVVNWVLIPKASFASNEYTEMQFGVLYDVENDWIEQQWDGSGNVVGVNYATKTKYEIEFNYCDVTDWNFDSSGFVFFTNLAQGIYNNSNHGDIFNNICTGGTFSNNSNAFAIVDNIVWGINGNSNNGSILDNIIMNTLSSNSNVGAISFNRNNGPINNNSNVGTITQNRNNGFIDGCSSGANPCNIFNNINNGNISGTFAADVTDTIVNKS